MENIIDKKVKEDEEEEVYKLGKICLARIVDEESGERALVTPKPEGLTDKDWESLKKGGDHILTSRGWYNLMSTSSGVEHNPCKGSLFIEREIYINF